MVHCSLNATMNPRVKVIVWSLSVGALLCFFIGFFYYQFAKKPNKTSDQQTVIFQVDRSTSARSFVNLLKKHHLIQSEAWFLAKLRLGGLSTQLQAGIYQINPGESAEHLLERVVHGDVLKERFQIIEGTTWTQVQTNLKKAPYLTFQHEDIADINTKNLQCHANQLKVASVSTKRSEPIARSVEQLTALCQESNPPELSELEGLFLADTYQYEAGSHAKAMLYAAHQHLYDYLLQAWKKRAAWLPYRTPYELLIAASILEKESAISDERRLISGVIVNRLAQNMPLQMDPTVIYGLGSRYTGSLSHEDLQDNSPYNTYRNRGLPPAPIAMVGRDAIDAAADPIQTKNLYFVAKGDGTHVFSETYEKQREAIQRYMRKSE